MQFPLLRMSTLENCHAARYLVKPNVSSAEQHLSRDELVRGEGRVRTAPQRVDGLIREIQSKQDARSE